MSVALAQPKPSATAIAVLALVIDQPSHGYEIWLRFDRLYRDVKPVGQAAVYKALRQLRMLGLVETTDSGRSTARQSVADYRATAAGIRCHRDRIAQDLRTDPGRDDLHHRLLRAHGDPLALADILDRYEQLCLDAADRLSPLRSGAPMIERMLAAHERGRLTWEANFVKIARRILEEDPT